mgnify:FL=1
MTRNNRQRILFWAAISVFLALIADRTLFTPALQFYQARRLKIQQLQPRLAKARGAASQAELWEMRMDRCRRNALPVNASAAENMVITMVRDWANETGLTISSMRTNWTTGKSRDAVLEIRLNGSGNIEAASRFLYAAETAAAPLQTAKVTLFAPKDAARGIELTAELHTILWIDGSPSSAGDDA